MNNADGLTPKQKRFCDEYAVDLNATAAAKRAGYSKRTAEVQGCRLLRNAQVARHVAELQEEAAKRNEVTVDQVIGMLIASYTDAKAANQHGPAVRAAELLGKRLGMFRDRVEVEGSGLSDEQLIERLAGHNSSLAAELRKHVAARDTFG